MMNRLSRAFDLAAFAVVAMTIASVAVIGTSAQGGGRGGRGGGGRGVAARTAKDAAPIDLTGQWVSVVTEDYRFRMVTPQRGDYSSVPLTPAGLKLADSWS